MYRAETPRSPQSSETRQLNALHSIAIETLRVTLRIAAAVETIVAAGETTTAATETIATAAETIATAAETTAGSEKEMTELMRALVAKLDRIEAANGNNSITMISEMRELRRDVLIRNCQRDIPSVVIADGNAGVIAQSVQYREEDGVFIDDDDEIVVWEGQ